MPELRRRGSIAALALLLASGCATSHLPEQVAAALPPRGVLVAHALGGIDGVTYTNSAEAFESSYREGMRWFEIDLSVTADGDAVCFHPGHENHLGLKRKVYETSTAEFLSRRYAGRYTLMTFSDLLDRLESHRDAYLVTDTKGWDEPMVSALARALAGRPEDVVRRVVPQIYRPEDLEAIGPALGLTPRVVIFTLYRTAMDDHSVIAFARSAGIAVVATSTVRFRHRLAADLDRVGRPVLVHTVNSPVEALQLTAAGADGLITDFLRP